MKETWELMVAFSDQDDRQAAKIKRQVAMWLEKFGRTDFVEGVIDGVETALTDTERDDERTTDERLARAPIALFDEDRSALQSLASSMKKDFGRAIDVRLSMIPAEAWQDCWQPEFIAWRSRSFFIAPIAIHVVTPHGYQRIDIDASGEAFGTGQHNTTRCLLGMMETHWQEWKAASVLDVGTGTGLLAIVASKLGAQDVAGTEISEELVTLAQKNCTHNGVQAHLRCTPLPFDRKSYDLVIANILVPVLHDLMHELVRCLNPTGRLLLAGFVEKEMGPIVTRARSFGLEIEHSSDEGGWMGVALKFS